MAVGKDEFLAAIDEIYALRVADDKTLLGRIAPGATYQLMGEGNLMPGVATGRRDMAPTIEALIDAFQFHELKRVDAVVEGNKAAVLTLSLIHI